MSKLNDYLSQSNCVLVKSPTEVNLYVGDLDVIAYAGADKEHFHEAVAAYKAPPSASARRYKEYDFGGEIVVYSSLKNIVDLVELGPTTIPPAPVFEGSHTVDFSNPTETVVLNEAPNEDESDDEVPPSNTMTW